jgi:hypothetical protein
LNVGVEHARSSSRIMNCLQLRAALPCLSVRADTRQGATCEHCCRECLCEIAEDALTRFFNSHRMSRKTTNSRLARNGQSAENRSGMCEVLNMDGNQPCFPQVSNVTYFGGRRPISIFSEPGIGSPRSLRTPLFADSPSKFTIVLDRRGD